MRKLLAEQGWDVTGIDNNMRQVFFGAAGSTYATTTFLKETIPYFRHYPVDIRDRRAVRNLFQAADGQHHAVAVS